MGGFGIGEQIKAMKRSEASNNNPGDSKGKTGLYTELKMELKSMMNDIRANLLGSRPDRLVF